MLMLDDITLVQGASGLSLTFNMQDFQAGHMCGAVESFKFGQDPESVAATLERLAQYVRARAEQCG